MSNGNTTPPPAVEGSLAEQLGLWAYDLESPLVGRSSTVDDQTRMRVLVARARSIIAGMREVALDLRQEEGKAATAPTPLPKHRERNHGLDYDWGRLPVTVAAGGGASGDTIRMIYKGLLGLNADIEWVEDGHTVRHVVRVAAFEQLDSLEPVLIGEMLTDQGDSLCSRVVLRFSAIRSVEVS